jgi:subtilisin family serine protease
VKVLGADGIGQVSEVICGIEWVTAYAKELGIGVANMSLSHRVQSDALHLAVQRSVSRGMVYTVAAGNNSPGLDIAGEIPAAYPEVLTVTAMADSDGSGGGTGPAFTCGWPEADDSFFTGSNFATQPADVAHVVAAPGVCIQSTARGGGEVTMTGTSAAAPHVAGVVAVCIGAPGQPGPCADMTPAEVIAQVRADAAANATPQLGFVGDPLSPVDRYYGHLVSAADPTVRRIAARPPPAPAAAAKRPRPDKVLEGLAMRIRRRQDVDTLRVVARLAEPGTVSAKARVQLPGGSARLILFRPAAARVEANRPRRLGLRLRRPALRRVKRALRRGKRMRARVTMTVSDAAGNARSKTAQVRLTR